MTINQKYQRCMVMAGGGFRFGYFLGMYAAAVETGNRPDLLLASCGGSIAAAIIHALPDDGARKDWVSSAAMYDFLCSLQSTPKAAIHRTVLHAVKRRLQSGRAEWIPDLFDDYFFDIPAQLPLPLPAAIPEVALAIVGGKILFTQSEVGQPRAGRKLFAETVFCNARSAALLEGMQAPLSELQWGDNTVAPALLTDISMPIGDAVRISISDMFYFRCHSHGTSHYTGGVIDLFPIEVAHRLANHVTMEIKSPFNQTLSIPAWRAVLGIDGNARLRHVHRQVADVWVDASDVDTVLANNSMQKKLAWRQNRIRLIMPPTHASYVADVEAQWQYGYRRALEAFGHAEPNHTQHMRYKAKHN
ncbi:MAG: patatin-like phospholipase family protein [Pseudomonadota bacterium]